MMTTLRRCAGPLALVATMAVTACDEKQDDAGAAASATAAAKPAVQLVARDVSIQKTINAKPPGGGDESESFTALEGKVYVVVTTDITHNSCQDGEEIDSKQAKLALADGGETEVVGGGQKVEEVCVLCQAKAPAQCSGGSGPLRPFAFVFSVPEGADVSKAKITYKGGEAELGKATITDRRGNDELDQKIAEKRAQVDALRKTLENTGSVAKGKIIQGEMADIEAEIAKLEAQRK